MTSEAPKSDANPLPSRAADTRTKAYTGGCHCGKFEFECRHPILEDGAEVVSCNCSICEQRGYLLIYIMNPADFKLLKGTSAELKSYKFNKHVNAHNFCPECGSGIFTEVNTPGFNMICVNVRAIKNLDMELEQLKIKKAYWRDR